MNLPAGSPQSLFVMTVCQVGAEPTLKKEVSLLDPKLKFAFSRPGFVTFKSTHESPLGPEFKLASVFARAYGLSLGKFESKEKDETELIAQIFVKAREIKLAAKLEKMRLHFWERDLHVPGEEPLGYVPGEKARKILARLRSAPEFSELFFPDEMAKVGDFVFDVTIVEDHQWWFGAHLHSGGHSPYSGGRPDILLPTESPSRAYLKLEEAILNFQAPVRRGDIAVEIGSAPGGASYALLQRGVSVVGIDPAEMSETVLKFKSASGARFEHIKEPVNRVPREILPAKVEWLLLDMNVEPRITVFAVDRLATRMIDSLMGIFLTIKLNRWEIADEIPGMLEHVKVMGMVRVRVAQLSHHRQELLIYGLTRRGVQRFNEDNQSKGKP